MISQEKAIKDVLGDFIASYAQRDKSIGFSDWLENRLRQEIPDMPKETSVKLAGEIIEAVAGYDQTLKELNTAIKAGQSKEEFFAERMAQSYADLPPEVAGKRLQQIENAYTASNLQLVQELDTTQQEDVPVANANPVNWNEYSLKDKTYQIAKKVGLSGLAAAANALKYNMESTGAVGLKDGVSQALKESLKTDRQEVKAAVAGAVKVVVVKGLSDTLPSDTPTEAICDMAGAAVESAEALCDAANEKTTMTEALDKVGRAGVAVGCRCGAAALKGVLRRVPIVGPPLTVLLGGLFDHMEGPKFAENVYHVVHDTAVTTWEGIKETGKQILHGLANLKNIFAN